MLSNHLDGIGIRHNNGYPYHAIFGLHTLVRGMLPQRYDTVSEDLLGDIMSKKTSRDCKLFSIKGISILNLAEISIRLYSYLLRERDLETVYAPLGIIQDKYYCDLYLSI